MSRKFSVVVISVLLQVIVFRETYCGLVRDTARLTVEEITHLEEIGKDLNKKLSPVIEPCDDFNGYVCARSNQSRSHESHVTKTIEMLQTYLSKTEGLTDPELKLKSHLESCKRASTDDLLKFVKEFNFPDSIGGWPVFDPNWNPDKFDLQSIIAELNSYHISVLVDQSFDAEKDSPIKKFLSINVEDFDLVLDSDKKQRLTEKIAKLGLEIMDEVVADAELLEKECAALVSSEQSTDEEKVETDFSGLKTQIPEIDWDKQIEVITGQKLKEDYPVVIRNGEVLRKVLSKVSEMNPKTVANYFFLQFVYHLPEPTDPDIQQYCARQSAEYFISVVTGIFLKEYFTEELKPMVYSLMAVLQESFNVIEDLPAGDVVQNIEELLNEAYFPQFSDEALKAEYEDIQIDPNNLFKNIYALRRHLQRIETQRTFLSDIEKLAPVSYLLSAMFTANLVDAINQPSMVAYDALTLEFVAVYTQMLGLELITDSLRECFSKQRCGGGYTDQEILAVAAAEIFGRGYFNWADRNDGLVRAEDEVLQEYGLSTRKILFIRFMQFGCGVNEVEAIKRMSLLFLNSQEFAEAFSCPTGSKMNPAEKCRLAGSKSVKQ